ncbi:hypothetical protein BGZ98_004768, partial [Dissophora globulifera]
MEDTQPFRLIGTNEIQNIPIQHIDGRSVVDWQSIEQVFPVVIQVKNGDVAIPHHIESTPGVVLDVVLSGVTEHLNVESLVGAPNKVPTAALATALTVDLTDAPVGPTDAPAGPPAELPSEDKCVEGPTVTSASETLINDIRVSTLLIGSSIKPPNSHSKVKATSKIAP